MPSWQQNIPAATDKLSVSQADIQGNFQTLNTWVDTNHYLPTDLLNGGKHKYVVLPEQSPNGPATAVNEMALYTKQSSISGATAMFIRPEDTGAAGNEIEFTTLHVVVSAGPTKTQGWTRLPSGIIMQWGKVTLGTGATASGITYLDVAFADSDYSIVLTAGVGMGTLSLTSQLAASFTFSATVPGASGIFYYQAIGR